jgi:ubiquinone/menaquinone biosynthesis C-methylase UbiE
MEDTVRIANYEQNDYQYSGFWKGREYEHMAEVSLLKRVFSLYCPQLENSRVIDIGGAYGRLAGLYAPTANEVVLADYSTNELKDGIENLSRQDYASKLSFVALNAYKMPFVDNSFDVALSVRVMHHLKDTRQFFAELQRILVPGGVAIIEFANNRHVLARARALFKGKAIPTITEVTHKTDAQGIKEGQVSVMHNFDPTYVTQVARDLGFTVRGTFTCSFLRHRMFKKVFSLKVLSSVEIFFQRMFQSTALTPSIFIVLQKPGAKSAEIERNNLFACPICKSPTVKQQNVYTCSHAHSFSQSDNAIVDLRDPRPEEVTY